MESLFIVPLVILLLLLGVLAVLMPYYVYRIARTTDELRKVSISMLDQQMKVNKLQRQLLRAYGHEPEV